MLLHVGCAEQSWVCGLIDMLGVVLAFNFYHALGRNVLEWSQEASPTAVDSAGCTAAARSYGSLAVNRWLGVYRGGHCLAKLDRVMSAK